MSIYFHCDLCDKSVKIRSEKKHLNSEYHQSLYKSIICKYTVKNPSFLHVEYILQNFVDEYNKNFENYSILCKWKLNFSDTIINTKSKRLFNLKRRYASWNLRLSLIEKIEYFESRGQKFSHISEMNIVFIPDLTNTTYDHYLKIPKPMIECTIIKKLANNPKFIKAFNIYTSHPLIRKYRHIITDEENQDFI